MTSEINKREPDGRQQSVGQVQPEHPFREHCKTDRQAVEHQRRPDEGEESLHIVKSRLARDRAVQPGSKYRAALPRLAARATAMAGC